MKQTFIALVTLALTLANININAQVIEGHQTPNNSSNTKNKIEHNRSGMEFEYQGIDKGFGLGFNLVIKNIYLSAATISFDDIENVKRNSSGWNVGAGYNYRYYLAKMLYIEGRAGIGYEHVSTEYPAGEKVTEHHSPSIGDWESTTTEWKKDSNGEFFLSVSPRIGLKLFRIWGSDFNIAAGYRWDFIKFKFGKENTIDYFTVGASFTF